MLRSKALGMVAVLDPLAGRLDPTGGFIVTVGPGGEVFKGVLTRVNTQGLANHIGHRLGLQFHKAGIEALMQQALGNLFRHP